MFNVQRSMFNVLVLSHAVVVARLGEHAAGDLTGLAVLDGDSLDGGRCAQRECLTIQRACCRRHGAVGGVVDCCAVRTAQAHLRAFGERGVATDGRSSQRLVLRTATIRVIRAIRVRTTAAVL